MEGTNRPVVFVEPIALERDVSECVLGLLRLAEWFTAC